MAQLEDTINEDRFLVLEHIATEIRKILIGTQHLPYPLLAKEGNKRRSINQREIKMY